MAIAWLVAWGALLGGLGEFVARVTLHTISDRVNNAFHLNPQSFWMAPLANIPLFGLIVAVAVLLTRRAALRWRVACAVVLSLAALEVGFISQRIHILAVTVLAAGIGVQLARFADRWRPWIQPRIRQSAIALGALTAIGAVAWNARLAMAERGALRALPAPAQGAPNVLLLILDTVGASEMSLYGAPLSTSPRLERFAAEGIRFDRAIATAPWTLPSHASMFTGLYPGETSVGWFTPLDGAHPTLAERMQTEGYATGGFVGNLLFGNWMFGLNRGFIRYRDYAFSVDEVKYSSSLWRRVLSLTNAVFHRDDVAARKTARQVNGEFLAWQRSLGDRPFFAFLNYFDAHSPFAPPAPFDTMFIGRKPRSRRIYQGKGADSAVVRDLRVAYAGAVRYVDQEVGWLLDTLDRQGILRNTLVVVTSDHGEAFGEHGHLGHGSSLYLTQTHVPLLFLLPARNVRGLVVARPVSLRDLAATILDLAGARRASLPGHSLAALWRDSAVPAESEPSPIFSQVQRLREFQPWYPAFVGEMRAILDGHWHYITRADGQKELFRIDTDPLEQRNLVADSTNRSVADALQRKLDGMPR
jgi:arylsulfatase A-like enzyme